MTWTPEKFLLAWVSGPHPVWGYTYRGLGLHLAMEGSPKGRRPPRWIITHLGSGHKIGIINGSPELAQRIAGEVAEAGDWTFDGLQGWKNQFPDAAERMRDLIAKHPKVLEQGWGSGSADENTARQIAQARAA